MLPKAWLAKRNCQHGLTVMVQDVGPAMQGVMRDTLLLAGFHYSDIVSFSESPCKIERILLVDGLTDHGSYMSPVAMHCLQDLTSHVAPKTVEKLFIIRKNALTRRFAREDDAIEAAREAGLSI